MKKLSLSTLPLPKLRFLLVLSFTQVYHTSADAFNFFKKKDVETIKKDIAVSKKPQITLINTEGSYIIKPWHQQKIALEVQKRGTLEELKSTSIKSKVSGKQATISTQVKEDEQTAQVSYTLRVPEDAEISVTQTKGPVTINGIEGDIEVSLEQGSIDIKDATRMVIAKTGNGTITLRQKKLAEPSSIFLQAHKGNIILYLPRETRASLQAKVDRGTVTSDHSVTMTITTKLDKYCWDQLKKNISGVLGSYKDSQDLERARGSSPVTLEATRGNIQIKES